MRCATRAVLPPSPLQHTHNECTNRQRSDAEPALVRRHRRLSGRGAEDQTGSLARRHPGFVRWVNHSRAILSQVQCTDTATPIGGCGQMFEAIIVSAQFEKKMTLARHRLVNAALKEEIAAIHAWTPKCFTPAEWEKKKGSA